MPYPFFLAGAAPSSLLHTQLWLEFKYCEDTRPEVQTTGAIQQHLSLVENLRIPGSHATTANPTIPVQLASPVQQREQTHMHEELRNGKPKGKTREHSKGFDACRHLAFFLALLFTRFFTLTQSYHKAAHTQTHQSNVAK